MVPTVDRGLREADFWSIEMAGRQPLDEVDVGLVHLAQELAGVRGEGLDVAPLALGVDRVEGERGLARARQAREDDEPVARQIDADVLEVVLACPADDQRIGHLDQATGSGTVPNACSSQAHRSGGREDSRPRTRAAVSTSEASPTVGSGAVGSSSSDGKGLETGLVDDARPARSRSSSLHRGQPQALRVGRPTLADEEAVPGDHDVLGAVHERRRTDRRTSAIAPGATGRPVRVTSTAERQDPPADGAARPAGAQPRPTPRG